jgi:hypothetical protein
VLIFILAQALPHCSNLIHRRQQWYPTSPLLDDPNQVRRLLGWQARKFNGWMWCRTLTLSGLQPSELVFFTSNALAGLTLPVSSFLFTLLEFYGLQLQHLSLQPLALVAIFVHFCKLFAYVWLSVQLFWLFHVMWSSRRRRTQLSTYYFQLTAKGLTTYITSLSSGKWEHWRLDWMIMQADIHDRLALPTDAPMAKRSDWEKVHNLQRPYNPVIKRIQLLAGQGLTSMMVLFDFLSKRIAPLQHHARPT